MQIKLSLFIKPFHNVCFLLLALPLLGYPTAAQSEFPQPLSFLECQFLCWLQTVGLSIFLRKFSVNWRFCPKINIRQSENGNNELNFHLLIDTTLSPHYKGHKNSAYLVLTLIFAQILTSFDPYTDPYIFLQKLPERQKIS